MIKFAYVNGYRTHVPTTVDSFLAKLALLEQGVLNTPSIFQPMGRDMLRDLMYLDDTLSRMTLVTPLTNEAIGLDPKYNGTDTVDVLVYKLRDKHEMEHIQSYMTFIKGAVADPFLPGQDSVGHEGFQQAAVLGLHKARVLTRWLIEMMTGLKDL
jgi:hypothetical protein